MTTLLKNPLEYVSSWFIQSLPVHTLYSGPSLPPFSPSRGLRLPLELHPMIISPLHSPGERPDADTLAKCALVCREWYRPARKGLYRHVEISGTGRYRSLQKTFEKAQKDGNAEHYSSAVHVLSVHDLTAGDRISPAVLHAPKQFPSLEQLFIFGVHSSKKATLSYHRSLLMNLSQFRSVRHIHLHNFEIDSLDELRKILGALSNLETAILRTISWRKPESIIQFRPLFNATSWRLSRLSIADSTSNFIAPFFWAVGPQTSHARIHESVDKDHPPLTESDIVPLVELAEFVLNSSGSTLGSVCWEWEKLDDCRYPQVPVNDTIDLRSAQGAWNVASIAYRPPSAPHIFDSTSLLVVRRLPETI